MTTDAIDASIERASKPIQEVRSQRLEEQVITARTRPFFGVLETDELADFAAIVETTRYAIDM